MARLSLLFVTAAVASVAAVGNAVGLAASAAPGETPAPTRLGTQIAETLGRRDRQAVQRGRALDLREQAVRAAEARLKAQATTGANGAPAPEPAAAAPGGTAPTAYDDLARIYQAMKPAAAALVMEQLDLDVQMRVAQRMRERSTAQILAAMTPKGAAALTMALARRTAPRPMPGPSLRR